MEVEITSFDTIKVAYATHYGHYMECEVAWNKLMVWGQQKNLLKEETQMFGLCYDDPKETPPEELRYDACISIPENGIEGDENVKILNIENGEYAVTMVKGPYKNLTNVWEKLFVEWLPQSSMKYKTDVPCVERYLNSPKTTPEDELLTELRMPVY